MSSIFRRKPVIGQAMVISPTCPSTLLTWAPTLSNSKSRLHCWRMRARPWRKLPQRWSALSKMPLASARNARWRFPKRVSRLYPTRVYVSPAHERWSDASIKEIRNELGHNQGKLEAVDGENEVQVGEADRRRLDNHCWKAR